MIGGDASGWADQLLLLGVATARIAVAFALLPIFSTETVPTLVRNSIMISLGLISLIIQPSLDTSIIGAVQWASIFAKEAFVGVLIGKRRDRSSTPRSARRSRRSSIR